MLDEKFQQNHSKFAIFYIYENPKLLFPFFISCYFIFSPNECPGLCQHRPGHSLGKKIKQHEMKNGKSNFGFSFVKSIANFEAFHWNFFVEHNPSIWEECCIMHIRQLNFFCLVFCLMVRCHLRWFYIALWAEIVNISTSFI